MSSVSNVIFVSGNVKKPKAARGRPRKAGATTKSRKTPAASQRSRSVVSSSVASDVDEMESVAQNEAVANGDVEVDDYDLMEAESVQFADSASGSEDENEEELNPQEAAPRAPKTKKTKKHRAAGPPPMETFINQTAFDVYFSYASSKLRISNNVLSSLIEPLTSDEVQSLEQQRQTRAEEDLAITRLCKTHEKFFPDYWFELHNGFNVLFHGYGSKKAILTEFGKRYCSKNGHVVVINGYNKRATLKAIIASIEQIPKLIDLPLCGPGWEHQLWRIYDFFRDERYPQLYVIIHNIESPSLRDRKVSDLLSTLALHPRIHFIASADHINTGTLWSSNEVSARKHPSSSTGSEIPSHRGYSWLFHDLTTFRPYVSEMKLRDVSTLPSQNQGASGAAGSGAGGQALTEPAMSHILASVTEKAKRLFRLLSMRQIEALEGQTTIGTKMASSSSATPVGVSGLENFGMQYDLLFNEARKDFLATSDVALRALLGEFMDHGMIVSGGQPEVLWIPAGKEVIKRALQNLESNS